MHLILRVLLTILLLLAPGTAFAACTVSNSTGTFAASGSYAVQANSVAQVVAPAGLTCTGSAISLLGSTSAKATVTSARGFHLLGPSGDLVPYVASADANGTYSFNQTQTIDYMNSTLLALLGISLSSGNIAPKIYLTINGGANVAAGTYSDTLTVQWNWTFCYVLTLGNTCLIGESSSGTSTIPVTIEVAKDCKITAPPVAFGSFALVSQFAPVSQSVVLNCTKGTSYNVGFSSGTSPSARPWRTMKDPSGNVLQYNLYRPDGVTIWDQSNPLASASNGTGTTTPVLAFPYKAQINTSQATPVAGHYSDTVSVVVTF